MTVWTGVTMTVMNTVDLITTLDAEGSLLARTLVGADWDAPVPGTDWDLRTLVAHTGAVHRWTTDILVRGLASNETGGNAAFRRTTADRSLAAWFTTGLAELVTALRSATDDLSAFTLIPGTNPRHFWARRQAHETAIHRADAQAAVGAVGGVTAHDVEVAQDGIGELVAGFATEPQFAADTPGTLLLDCTDGPSWLVVFGGERNIAMPSDGSTASTATVTGTSSAIYRWTWNRPAPVQVHGDTTTVESWQRVRI